MYHQTPVIPATGLGAAGICYACTCQWLPILQSVLLIIIVILLGLLLRQVYKLRKGETELKRK